jgi:hypothetical protein
MDEEIERLVVSVRADTASFARDVASMRGELEGPLVAGAGRAGRLIDSSLAKAILSGKRGSTTSRRWRSPPWLTSPRRHFARCSTRPAAEASGRVC